MKQELEEVGKVLVSIENEQGTNAKKSILQNEIKNSDYGNQVKLVLMHLFDPMVTTGISKTSWNNADGKLENNQLESFSSLKELLEYIQRNNTGKKDVINNIKYLYNSLENENARRLVYWIVTKDINIGLARKSIERFVYIPKFEIMLGSRLESVDENRKYLLTEKYDGVNLSVQVERPTIRFFTRQGKEVKGLDNLAREYLTMKNGWYFGEALYEGKAKDRKELYRLTAGEIAQKKDNKKIDHYVFAYCSLEDFKKKKGSISYEQELEIINKNIVNNPNLKHIHKVAMYGYGTGSEFALKQLEKVKAEGLEGLMLRYLDSNYECTRSKNLLKIKEFYTLDLEVIDYKEYKHPDMLGALVVDYKGFPVSVGSGFSKDQRETFWIKRNELIGKIIEVQTMEETENKDGSKSLRFPVFIQIRDDKDIPSYD